MVLSVEIKKVQTENTIKRRKMTDNSISLTGYEDEYIKNKSIELSKLLRSEVKMRKRGGD